MNGHETGLLRDGAGEGFPGSKVGAGTPAGVPEAGGGIPVVSLRSTTGYRLASLRDETVAKPWWR